MPGTPSERDPDDDWIERVVKVASALGFNAMRTRWKLIRWQESRRKNRRRLEQKITHITYQHQTCPECGAVQDREATICSRCEAKLGRRGFQILRRLGLGMPQALSISTLLALALLAVYVRVLVAAGGGLGSPSPLLLIDFGGRWPLLDSSEPWRLVTSAFLHAGLMHLAFNLLGLAVIGPQVEELYGRMTMLFLFLLTAVLANLGSTAMGTFGVGIGASGGLMGLIGVALGHGQRLGTSAGTRLRNDMVKWLLYTLVFGYAIGADNWAHVFGAVTGAAIGFALPPRPWRARRFAPLRAIVGAVAAVVAIGALVIIFTRKPSPPVAPLDADDSSYRGP